METADWQFGDSFAEKVMAPAALQGDTIAYLQSSEKLFLPGGSSEIIPQKENGDARIEPTARFGNLHWEYLPS